MVGCTLAKGVLVAAFGRNIERMAADDSERRFVQIAVEHNSVVVRRNGNVGPAY